MLYRKLLNWRVKRAYRKLLKSSLRKLDEIVNKRAEMHDRYLEAERKGFKSAEYYRGYSEALKWVFKCG